MEESSRHSINAAVLLESMTESVLITTAELEAPGPFIIYVNPAFEKMTGWSKEEVLGKTPRILQGPKTEHDIFHNMKRTLEDGGIWSGRTINYKKDDSEFYMEWSIAPVMDEHGRIYQYIAVQKEVTAIVRTEIKLQKAMELEQKRMLQIKQKNRTLNALIEKQRKTLSLFTKYVPEPIVKRALDRQSQNIRHGEQLEVALLFCDIRGFTRIAEMLSPEQVVHFLNTYYTLMSDVIMEYEGNINQFVGDEIFVSFGAPLPIEQPEASAVNCARAMIAKLEEINRILKDTVQEEIAVGIGIHFGPVIVGNLGSDHRLSYSITGDAVVTAKRIESLSRGMQNVILISQSIYDKTRDITEIISWGKAGIKGKNKKVEIYQVVT